MVLLLDYALPSEDKLFIFYADILKMLKDCWEVFMPLPEFITCIKPARYCDSCCDGKLLEST